MRCPGVRHDRNGGGMLYVEPGVTNGNRWLLGIMSGTVVLALGVWAAVAREKPATWVEPSAYEYTVQFRCGMQFPPDSTR
jgi:hypothetical protein